MIWRAALHTVKKKVVTLTLTLTLWLFPEYNHETSGITTDQSEQATLPLPLQFCQSTFRNSDFRGLQLEETERERELFKTTPKYRSPSGYLG